MYVRMAQPYCALALLFLGFSISIYSADVYGTVVDPEGLPVGGARIALDNSRKVAWSDAEGRFKLSEVAPGTHTVHATFDLFEAITLQVDVSAEDATRVELGFTGLRPSIASIEVVGEAAEALAEIPGAVASISWSELANSRPAGAAEVLRRVPGLLVRTDSGPASMRLNVGIRGLNPDRSRRVLMLEDGIPIALAPYGEPEMYYSPPIDRMRRVEILKGSGQIVHGPQTVGGVINFVTPEPPASLHGSVDVEGGQFGHFMTNASIGDSNRTGSAGWFASFLRKQGDGWRDFYYDINDAQGKLTLKPGQRHTLGVRFGFYDEGSNSTYLGLTTPMWLRDAAANPVPHDRLTVRRYSGAVNHSAALSPAAIWSNSFFAYHTVRDWGRQDWDRRDQGRDYLGVAGDPSVPGGAIYLRDSSGNRNRAFDIAGVQSGVAVSHRLLGLRAELNAGGRYVHEKAEDRRIDGDSFDARDGRLRDGEFRYGDAVAGYVQERVFLGSRVILSPGLRFEHYEYERDIYRLGNADVSRRRGDTVSQAIPGLGVSVRASEMLTLFGGVHRGFAPPRTKEAITGAGESLELDAELSWNYEAGARLRASRLAQAELTFFRLDFENQIITAAESGGATPTLENGGESLHQGREASRRMNWGELLGTALQIYTDARYMRLATAKFTRNNLFAGNRLPYAPGNTLAFLAGVRQRQGFGVQLDATFAGGQFADNRETVAPSPDGTVGWIPSYTIWNLGADYTVRRERFEVRPYVSVKNLGDERYIASRAPQGIQPGMFRQVNAGLRFTF